jgi:segregation and condensation protein A
MTDSTPSLMDGMSESFAKLYGEPLFALPNDLYIPPDALEIFLEAFEGPLDLLLYLIRKQNSSHKVTYRQGFTGNGVVLS